MKTRKPPSSTRHRRSPWLLLLMAALASASLACSGTPSEPAAPTIVGDHEDVHSFARPQEARVRHVALDLDVLFDKKILQGSATLAIERASDATELILDTRDLAIEAALASSDGESFQPTDFSLGPADPILGTPLRIALRPDTSHVRVRYATRPGATGLQWLAPAQTAGKKLPFLYSQSQAIHARSWIPLQDSPGIRVTYSATLHTPGNLFAVMSARMATPDLAPAERTGAYTFEMPQAIPPYLIAIAVGDLVFRPMSPRTGVYAEPSMAERAAREFEDTEAMMQAVERLYGPYRWERYDLLVLPPSFPFGGMENPRLTFVTPTVIAGDKSLVSLIAHELAHSWSGNLVSNATWRDFWLNEGFTTYLEFRIQELVYSRRRAEMEAALELGELERGLARLPDADEILHINLAGRDPDEGATDVPYLKGALFLRRLEEAVGREKFDRFLRAYFDHFAFQSITTGDFLDYLQANLLAGEPEAARSISLDEWINRPGLPADTPRPQSDALEQVKAQAKSWLAGETPAGDLPADDWSTQEWLHFLRSLTDGMDAARMRELDQAFRLTGSTNAEILNDWLLLSLRHGYQPADARLAEFLTTVGRRKFLRPLYTELAKTPEGKQRALAIYRRARPGYHSVSSTTIDQILGYTPD